MDWKSKKGKAVIVLISLSVLLPLIGNLLSNRKYASRAQADTACYEWADKGEIINFKKGLGFSDFSQSKSFNRRCRYEIETNQILGYEGEFTSEDYKKEGKELFYNDKPESINQKVVKSFYY